MPQKLNQSYPISALERPTAEPETACTPSLGKGGIRTAEGRQTLAEAIIRHGGIKPACKVLGIVSGNVFARMHTDQELALAVRTARATLAEQLLEQIREHEDLLLSLRGAEATNERISAIREVLHSLRWRIGKFNVNYSDKPHTQVNNLTQIGVVCDEKTRAQLIALREQIKAPLPSGDNSSPATSSDESPVFLLDEPEETQDAIIHPGQRTTTASTLPDPGVTTTSSGGSNICRSH